MIPYLELQFSGEVNTGFVLYILRNFCVIHFFLIDHFHINSLSSSIVLFATNTRQIFIKHLFKLQLDMFSAKTMQLGHIYLCLEDLIFYKEPRLKFICQVCTLLLQALESLQVGCNYPFTSRAATLYTHLSCQSQNMEGKILLFLKRHLVAFTFPYITIIVITTQAELAHIGGLSSFIIIYHY